MQMLESAKPYYHIFGHIHELGCQQEVTPATIYLNVFIIINYYIVIL